MRTTKMWVFSFYLLLAVIMLTLGGFGLVRLAPPTQAQSTPAGKCPSWPLPLPSVIGPVEYQKQLNLYVSNFCYQKDKTWKGDSEYRDTGFVFGGKSYGVHNAVRVYYSPEMWKWMEKGYPEDKIPEKATVIKEMYPAPASQTYTNADMTGLAIMVRDTAITWDGWYWTDGGPTINYSANYPSSGYGLYCLNCHASTAKTDVTFSSLTNITGDPIVFNPTMPPNQILVPPPPRGVRGEMMAQPTQMAAPRQKSEPGIHEKRDSRPDPPEPGKKPTRKAKPASAAPATRLLAAAAVPIPKQMIMEYFDNVTQGPRPKGQRGFLTSNQCIGCHDATQNNASQPNMVYPQIYTTPPAKQTTEIDLNLSPYGEWRASIMGLSGRDPIFYAQLESELNLHPEQTDNIVGTCLSCHGVMGQRQIELDKKGPFKLEYLDQIPPWPIATQPIVSQPYAKYGALARDGVSCTVCHRITPEGLGTPASYTGKFKVGKPDEIYGPYEDVVTLPMTNALGLTPRQTKENQIRSSALCGSCHTVVLPILDVDKKYSGDPFNDPNIKTEHEQNTYIEWLNSIYQNERPPINPATAQTCQDCHMPGKYPSKTGKQLQFKVASIEEDIFPAVDFRAPDKDIHLRVRGADPQQPYSRHMLLGINIFALEIFDQFSDTLGLVPSDPMAGYWGNPPPGLVLAKKSGLDLARNETATVEILSAQRTAQGLTTKVQINNLAGHKFPSGVSFRRAFIELRVDVGGKTYWASGATNEDGVIGTFTNGRFKPLVSESFDLRKNPQQIYQPHYETIDSEDKVQIYEELIKNSEMHFTTSFLSLAHPVKDNRLMPKGWKCIDRPDGKTPASDKEPCGGTAPHGVIDDPRTHPNSAGYFNGTGSDIVVYEVPFKLRTTQPITVTATLYYQTIPPYYLEQRYNGAPMGTVTKSLKYYVENLNVNRVDPDWKLLLNEAPVKDWKLMIATRSKTIK